MSATCLGLTTGRLPCALEPGHLGRHREALAESPVQRLELADEPRCESCGRRRETLTITLSGDVTFRVCAQCAVVAIRTGGHTTAELHFPVGPDEDGAA